MKDARDAWPYANEAGQEETVVCDVLVLGEACQDVLPRLRLPGRGRKLCWWKRERWNEAAPPEPDLTIGSRPVQIHVPK